MAGSSNTAVKSAASNFGEDKIVWTWVADDANGSVPNAQTSEVVTGYVMLGVTNPGATAPTDNYDITVLDEDGVDVFGGELTNRDTANSEQATPLVGSAYGPRFVNSKLTMALANNSVNSATGALTVFVERSRR